QVNRNKLKEPDKTKYQIHQAVSAALVKSKNWEEFIKAVYKQGVKMQPKFKGNTKEIQGISFEKNGYSFKGSEIDRKFSFANLDKLIKRNAEKAATKTERVSRIGQDGIIYEYLQKEYTPPSTENISLVFAALITGSFEPYYNNMPDDSLIRKMKIKKKKKIMRL
ncbi:relaxase/mobilization nuclease domain-containing protein, partial [Coprobacter sp. LH1063]